jgi:hypothetical protein
MNNKKALRKELELILVKTIEGVLTTHNVEATKKIKRTTTDASKTIAKKFYKTIKTVSTKKPATSKNSAKKPVRSVVTKAKIKK